MDNSKLAEALAAAEPFLTPGERSVLRDDPSGRMAGFEQEWQRESKLVSLARERERARVRPLLETCLALIQELEPPASFSDPRPDVTKAIADLRREMGIPEEGER